MVWLIFITIILEITSSGLLVTSCQIYLVGEAEEGELKRVRERKVD